MVSKLDCYAGGVPFESGILPLLKHKWGNSHQPPCWSSRGNISCMSLLSVNKAAHSGFETQRRLHQKSKTRISVVLYIGHVSTKNV